MIWLCPPLVCASPNIARPERVTHICSELILHLQPDEKYQLTKRCRLEGLGYGRNGRGTNAAGCPVVLWWRSVSYILVLPSTHPSDIPMPRTNKTSKYITTKRTYDQAGNGRYLVYMIRRQQVCSFYKGAVTSRKSYLFLRWWMKIAARRKERKRRTAEKDAGKAEDAFLTCNCQCVGDDGLRYSRFYSSFCIGDLR